MGRAATVCRLKRGLGKRKGVVFEAYYGLVRSKVKQTLGRH